MPGSWNQGSDRAWYHACVQFRTGRQILRYVRRQCARLDGAALRKLSPEQIKQTMCMDESTIEMAISKAVSEEMEASGATCMDAPVSGGQLQITPLQTFVHANVVLDLPAGVIGAKNATLTIMVGSSSQDAFERAKPVLETMGKKVLRCGDLGAGLAAKIANK